MVLKNLGYLLLVVNLYHHYLPFQIVSSGSQASEMLDMLVMFKMGDCNGIRVRVDRLQTLIASSFVEHLDFQVPDGW